MHPVTATHNKTDWGLILKPFWLPLLLCPNYVLYTITDEVLQLEAIEYVTAVFCF